MQFVDYFLYLRWLIFYANLKLITSREISYTNQLSIHLSVNLCKKERSIFQETLEKFNPRLDTANEALQSTRDTIDDNNLYT